MPFFAGNQYYDGSNLRYVRAGGAGFAQFDISTAGTGGDFSVNTAPVGAVAGLQTLTERLRVRQTDGALKLNSGPTISTGSTVPTSAEPNGSIYMYTGGSGGLYVRQGGSWVLK
jgi:hypothetical protein